MQNLPVVPNLLRKIGGYRYRAARNGWKHIHLNKDDDRKCPAQVRIITWNISFDMIGPVQRLEAALRYLETDILECQRGEAPEPCCILFQELNAAVFSHLLENPWIRDHFVITPNSPDKWPKEATYGNVTLISRSIPIVDCAIVHFGSSVYQRTGVIVDIRLKNPSKEPNDDEDYPTFVLRIINTHLESLQNGLIARRMQLELLSKMLPAGGERQGGLIAGDMNPIGPNDHEHPGELGLEDAWRHPEDSKEGHTWGYQGATQYPAARLDKVLYLPLKCYKVDEPKRVGVGLSMRDPTSGKDMPLFVSDHYGLDTKLRMTR